jgi:hypothetical protein
MTQHNTTQHHCSALLFPTLLCVTLEDLLCSFLIYRTVLISRHTTTTVTPHPHHHQSRIIQLHLLNIPISCMMEGISKLEST